MEWGGLTFAALTGGMFAFCILKNKNKPKSSALPTIPINLTCISLTGYMVYSLNLFSSVPILFGMLTSLYYLYISVHSQEIAKIYGTFKL